MNHTLENPAASASSTEQPNNDRILKDAFAKMVSCLKETPFGEVGFSVTVHEGQILRVKHVRDETFKACPNGIGV